MNRWAMGLAPTDCLLCAPIYIVCFNVTVATTMMNSTLWLVATRYCE
jgi:hypothetical protein